jgi:hypothetical protein
VQSVFPLDCGVQPQTNRLVKNVSSSRHQSVPVKLLRGVECEDALPCESAYRSKWARYAGGLSQFSDRKRTMLCQRFLDRGPSGVCN